MIYLFFKNQYPPVDIRIIAIPTFVHVWDERCILSRILSKNPIPNIKQTIKTKKIIIATSWYSFSMVHKDLNNWKIGFIHTLAFATYRKSKYLQCITSDHDRTRMCHQADPRMPEHMGKRSPAQDAWTNLWRCYQGSYPEMFRNPVNWGNGAETEERAVRLTLGD